MFQSSSTNSTDSFLTIKYDKVYHLSNIYSFSKPIQSVDIDIQNFQINIHKDTYEILFYFLYSPIINSIMIKTSSESQSLLQYKERDNDNFDQLLLSKKIFPLSKYKKRIYSEISKSLNRKLVELKITLNQISVVLQTNESIQLCKLDINNSLISISQTLSNSHINLSIYSVLVENHKLNNILQVYSQVSNAISLSLTTNKDSLVTTMICDVGNISAELVPTYFVVLLKELYSPIIFSNFQSSPNKKTYSISNPFIISVKLNSFSTKLMNSLNVSEYVEVSLSYSTCELSLCNYIQSCSISVGEILIFSSSNNIKSTILSIPSIIASQHHPYDYLDTNINSVIITLKIESIQTVHAIIHSYNFSKNDKSLTMSLSDSNLSSIIQPQKKKNINSSSSSSSSSSNSFFKFKINISNITTLLIEKNIDFEISIKQITSQITMSYTILKFGVSIESIILTDNMNSNYIICQFGVNEQCKCLKIESLLNKYRDSSVELDVDFPILNVSENLSHFVDHLVVIIDSFSFASSSDTGSSNESLFPYSPIILTCSLNNCCISVYDEINIRILFNLTLSCLYIDNNESKILSSCILCNKVDFILLTDRINNNENENQLICSIPFSITCSINMINKTINLKLCSLIPIKVRINGTLLLPLLNQSQNVQQKEESNSLPSFLSILSSYSYVLNTEIKIDNVSIYFISDVYSSTYPFLLFKIPVFSLKLSDSMSLCLNTSCSLSYFDRSLSHWQPVLEECSIQINITIGIDANRISLGISVILLGNDENKTIEVNFLPSFMHEVLCYLNKYKYILNEKKDIKKSSNLIIYNYSGLTLYHISIPLEKKPVREQNNLISITIKDTKNRLYLISTLNSDKLLIFDYYDSKSQVSSISSIKANVDELQIELCLDLHQNIILQFSSISSFKQWSITLFQIINGNKDDNLLYFNNLYQSCNNLPLKTTFFQNKLKERINEIPNCSMYNINMREQDNDRIIQFQIGYETESLSIDIDKCIVTHYNIRYNKSTLPVIIDTSLNDYNKSLIIRSAIEISVYESISLKINLFSDKKEMIETHTIQSKYYIPIKYCELNSYIQFELRNKQSNIIQITEIVNHGNGNGQLYISFNDGTYLLCYIQNSLSHSINDNSTTMLYNLNIVYPLTVYNTTFYDINYEITNILDKVILNQKMRKLKTESILIKQNFKDEDFFITVKNQFKNDSISKSVSLSVNQPITIPFDHDIQRKVKYISIDLMKLPNGSYSLYFYSDVWIINHSGVDLFTYVKCNKAFINLPASYCQLCVDEKKIIDKSNWESQITSISFSNENEMILSFSDQSNGIQSQPFYIRSVNIPTPIQIPLYHNDCLHYDVEITGAVLDDIYFHTKIIEILPSYWIWNGSINSFNIKQTSDSNIKRIDSHMSLPYQWNYSVPNSTIQIQIYEIDEEGEGWNWSGNITIDNDPITIRLYTINYKRCKFINISHILIKGSIILCINDVPEDLTSHSIVNDCLNHSILIYEDNTNTNTIQSLLPLSRSSFGFIHPNESKLIYILVKPYAVHSDDIDSYYKNLYIVEIPYKFTSSITQKSLEVVNSKDGIHFFVNVEYVNNQFILHISSSELPSLSLSFEGINKRIIILQKEIEYEQKMVNKLEQTKLPSNKVSFDYRPDYLVIQVLYALNLPIHSKGTACLFDNRKSDSVSCITTLSGRNVSFYQLLVIKVQSIIDIFIGDGYTNANSYIASGQIDVGQLKFDQITKMTIPLHYLYKKNNTKKISENVNCCLFVNIGFTNNIDNYYEDNSKFRKAILSKMLKHSKQIIQYYDKEIQYCSSILENQTLSSTFLLKPNANIDNTLVITKTRVLAKSNNSMPVYLAIQTIDNIYHSDILSTSKLIENKRIKYSLIPFFSIKIINNKVIINKLSFTKDSSKYSMIIPGSEVITVNNIQATIENFDSILIILSTKKVCRIEIETPNVYEYIWNYKIHLSERECLSEIFILTYQIGDETNITNNNSSIHTNEQSEQKLDSYYIDSFTEYYSLNGKLAKNIEDNLLGKIIYTYNNHINSQSLLMVNDRNKTSIDISIKSNPIVKSIISQITSHIYLTGISITLYDNTPSEICNLSLSTMNIVFEKNNDSLFFETKISNIELSDTSGESIYPVVLSYHYKFEPLVLSIHMKSLYIIDAIVLAIPV